MMTTRILEGLIDLLRLVLLCEPSSPRWQPLPYLSLLVPGKPSLPLPLS